MSSMHSPDVAGLTGFSASAYDVVASSPGSWAEGGQVTIWYRFDSLNNTPEVDVRVAVSGEPVETFASIGATHFDITFKHLSGERRGFRCNRDLAEVRESIPPLVESTTRRENNLIVRPRVDGAACIQLDDLDREKATRIAPAAFLMLETSPGSYQAWVAVKDAPLGLTQVRLRRR